MSLGAVIALSSVLFSGSLAALHFAMARAPGWREARVFGVIALTSALYACSDLVTCSAGVPEQVYELAARVNYVAASAHVVAWLAYFFGGPERSIFAVPRPVRWLALATIVIAVSFAVTGLHMRAPERVIHIDWAATTYHYQTTTLLGDLYGLWLIGVLGVSFVTLVGRAWRGEPGMRVEVVSFTLFFACSAVEVLVASDVFLFLSLGDFGFLIIVLSTGYQLARRFLADARALHALSNELRGQVEVRTEERDAVQRELLEVEPLAALGRLAAGVGHEINNPLVYVRSGLDRVAEYVADHDAPADVRAAVDEAGQGLRRIQSVVEELRVYSDEPLSPTSSRVARLVARAVDSVRPLLGARRVEVEVDDSLRVLVDAQRLVDAIGRVLRNSIQATAGSGDAAGRIRISSRTFDNGEISVVVADDGAGIEPSVRARLGEPYFTTRAHEGALGLGLFAVRAVLGAHGGRFECESEVGRGTTVRLVLPAMRVSLVGNRTMRAPLEQLSEAPPSNEQRPRVLIVDDEPLVLRGLERLLSRRWEVVTAEGAERALEILREQAPFDALLSDVMMPGVSGIELAERLSVEFAELRTRTLFITGGVASPDASAFLARGDVRYLTKPVAPATLVAELEALLQRKG